MAKIVEYVLETSHAMVGNTIDTEYSVIIAFRANATVYPFSTYVLNENRPGIRKNCDSHHSLRDAVLASGELLAERREVLTRQLSTISKDTGPYFIWKQQKPDCPAFLEEVGFSNRNAAIIAADAFHRISKWDKVWVADANDEIIYTVMG